MANKKTDKICTGIRICVDSEMNEEIEKHQAKLRLKSTKVRKEEAAEKFIEELYRIAKPLMK